jgi:myosin heavy subunit
MQRRVQKKKKKVVEKRRIIGLEDMILLTDTKDSGICENLKERLGSSQIYTFIGHVRIFAMLVQREVCF